MGIGKRPGGSYHGARMGVSQSPIEISKALPQYDCNYPRNPRDDLLDREKLGGRTGLVLLTIDAK